MDISFGELKRMPIKKLKALLKKLSKEPKSVPTDTTIDLIKTIIEDKKRKGIILHPEFVKGKDGFIRQARCKPVHLIQ